MNEEIRVVGSWFVSSMFVLLITLGAGALGCATGDADDDSAPAGDDDATADDDDATGADDDDVGDDDDTTPGDDDDAQPDEDAAEVVTTVLPTTLACGETVPATVEMRNTGLATWTAADGYKLGTVDDEDPFYGPSTRVYMADEASVEPGGSYTFSFELTAPDAAGEYVTDWQMVHEAVTWFGDVASQTVSVECAVQTYTDPLTEATLQPGFDEKIVNGGVFSAAGWQTTSESDQLRLTLTNPVHGDGALEIDVTNFDPATQYSRDKHQIIDMYTTTDGTQAVFDTDEAWWNIRTGNNYYTGFKFLASPNGGDEREEVRLMESATWDPADLHTFRVEWNSVDVDIHLDGVLLHTLPFDGRVQPLQVIFVGKDNVYLGQVGPIYSNLRVTYEP